MTGVERPRYFVTMNCCRRQDLNIQNILHFTPLQSPLLLINLIFLVFSLQFHSVQINHYIGSGIIKFIDQKTLVTWLSNPWLPSNLSNNADWGRVGLT